MNDKLLEKCPKLKAMLELNATAPTVEERLAAVETVIADIMLMQLGGDDA